MTGATLVEIAEVLGHKTLAMVKRYSLLSEKHKTMVVARMNEEIVRVFGDRAVGAKYGRLWVLLGSVSPCECLRESPTISAIWRPQEV